MKKRKRLEENNQNKKSKFTDDEIKVLEYVFKDIKHDIHSVPSIFQKNFEIMKKLVLLKCTLVQQSKLDLFKHIELLKITALNCTCNKIYNTRHNSCARHLSNTHLIKPYHFSDEFKWKCVKQNINSSFHFKGIVTLKFLHETFDEHIDFWNNFLWSDNIQKYCPIVYEILTKNRFLLPILREHPATWNIIQKGGSLCMGWGNAHVIKYSADVVKIIAETDDYRNNSIKEILRSAWATKEIIEIVINLRPTCISYIDVHRYNDTYGNFTKLALKAIIADPFVFYDLDCEYRNMKEIIFQTYISLQKKCGPSESKGYWVYISNNIDNKILKNGYFQSTLQMSVSVIKLNRSVYCDCIIKYS